GPRAGRERRGGRGGRRGAGGGRRGRGRARGAGAGRGGPDRRPRGPDAHPGRVTAAPLSPEAAIRPPPGGITGTLVLISRAFRGLYARVSAVHTAGAGEVAGRRSDRGAVARLRGH